MPPRNTLICVPASSALMASASVVAPRAAISDMDILAVLATPPTRPMKSVMGPAVALLEADSSLMALPTFSRVVSTSPPSFCKAPETCATFISCSTPSSPSSLSDTVIWFAALVNPSTSSSVCSPNCPAVAASDISCSLAARVSISLMRSVNISICSAVMPVVFLTAAIWSDRSRFACHTSCSPCSER